jgi:hypothetical protein
MYRILYYLARKFVGKPCLEQQIGDPEIFLQGIPGRK